MTQGDINRLALLIDAVFTARYIVSGIRYDAMLSTDDLRWIHGRFGERYSLRQWTEAYEKATKTFLEAFDPEGLPL